MTLQTFVDSISKVFNYYTAKYFNSIHFELVRPFQYNFETELKTRNIHDLEYAIDELVEDLGVPSSRILIDLSFGGFKMLSPDDLKQHINGYDYICFHIIYKNFNLTYNSDVGVGIATDSENQTVYMIESSRVIANEIRFAVRKNLGGAFINSIDYDDHEHRCEKLDSNTYADYNSSNIGVTLNIPARNKRHPFYTNIVDDAFVVALDEIKQEKNSKKIFTESSCECLKEQ